MNRLNRSRTEISHEVGNRFLRLPDSQITADLAVPIRGPLQVVISYYAARSSRPLEHLLDQLLAIKPGWPIQLRVIVNREGLHGWDLPERFRSLDVRRRPNEGFNIGAWEAGWRGDPFAEAYLFLQDDCWLCRPGWANAFVEKLNEPGIGLVGESINRRWCRTWEALERDHRGRTEPEHDIAGRPVDRVRCYLHHFHTWGIAPGETAEHLQSLILAARRPVLEAIGGFPLGRNKGAAIAAEIGISKRVQQLGLQLSEVGPMSPGGSEPATRGRNDRSRGEGTA